MKRYLTICVLAATGILCFQFTSGAKAPETQVEVSVRWIQGDPEGSPRTSNQKVLHEPMFATSANNTFSFVSGGQIPISLAESEVRLVYVGLKIICRVGSPKDGKVDVDIAVSDTQTRDNTELRSTFRTESHRFVGTVTLGKPEKLLLVNRAPNDQEWIELLFDEGQPWELQPERVRPHGMRKKPAIEIPPPLALPPG